MLKLNNDWEFTEIWSDEFLRFQKEAAAVRLPHNVGELPLHYADPSDYSRLCGYRRRLAIPASQKGKRFFLQFDGAAHIATVFCNRQAVAVHNCGYTAFRAEITDLLRFDEENEIAVRLDTSENAAIPPFGFVVDYLTFGGLYRDVWLDIRPQNYIEDVFIQTPTVNQAHIELTVDGEASGAYIRLLDQGGTCVYQLSGPGKTFDLTLQDARPWSGEDPYLYTCQISLLDQNNVPGDTVETRFGFRTAVFTSDGFFLNDKKTFLRGLNRHQSYPFIGYAAPEHLQREDARILKEELACTAVRTSHYPQSPYFIDECDRLGLLVFTEIPGWQHIGDEAWKDQAIENTREMVLQYRNHPSIILWGVRINESQDDDDFYRRTNFEARKLDPTRQTGGVRYLEKSSLLEDVYAFNDFSHDGTTPPVKKKKDVTDAADKAFLISEHNGHMFPTKPYDPWDKREEHAMRHARVQGAAFAGGEHVGCFGWCMFDYQTHKDFGSGDRICYHGVMDAFRNPKLAAAVYASQGEEKPVLETGSSMDIGDYPGGRLQNFYVFTNADSVDLYKNDVFVTSFSPKELTGLPHEPILIDDLVGDLLESEEGFPKNKAKAVRECLLALAKYGPTTLPLKYKLKFGWVMLRYRLSYADGVALYGKYVGNWGGETTTWRFEARKDNVVVASVERAPGHQLSVKAVPSKTILSEKDGYDMAAVRIRITDEFGNTLPYAQLPLALSVSGPIELASPSLLTAEGGMTGTYIRTTGRTGSASLTIRAEGAAETTVEFTVE
ncbi:MAG: glycoside hydrolase family 2 protein [Lachnospiraceae bacterium]|nr:glycoside hydrolase family 2 protein [Lachnospiraceae bacterium]